TSSARPGSSLSLCSAPSWAPDSEAACRVRLAGSGERGPQHLRQHRVHSHHDVAGDAVGSPGEPLGIKGQLLLTRYREVPQATHVWENLRLFHGHVWLEEVV